jgi:hypothetical protein
MVFHEVFQLARGEEFIEAWGSVYGESFNDRGILLQGMREVVEFKWFGHGSGLVCFGWIG